MKTIKSLILAIPVILTASAIFAGGTQEAEKHISIGLLPDVDSIPFVIADMNGYYTDEGVSVELQQFKNPVSRDTAFQAGETEAVISDLLAAALALNGGFNVKAVSMTNGSYKLLVSPDNDAESINDLAGTGIGISKNTIIEYATDKMLAAAGMSGSDIKKEIIPQIPVRLEMLAAGKIDGATLAEPLATASVVSGCRVLISTDVLGINPGIMLVNEEYLSDNKDTLKAVYRAYNRAVEYLQNTDREEYIDTLIETMGFPAAARDVMELPEYHPAVAPPEKEAEEVQEWLLERSLIEREFSYEELVDTSCLP